MSEVSMSHFNQVANSWDNSENLQRSEAFAKAIRLHLAGLKFKSILDFGCGTGLLSGQFYDETDHILGVDTSFEMLQMFQKKDGDKKVKTILLDLRSQDLPGEESFDLILSSMAFHHLDKPEVVLEKLYARLSPNGRICIIDLESEDGSFHPDNKNMGVKHFGFSNSEIQHWVETKKHPAPDIQTIFQIEKNNRQYGIFLSVFK